jgi:hypothetical protein
MTFDFGRTAAVTEHDWPLYANEPDRVILRGDLAEDVIWHPDINSDNLDHWYYDAPIEAVAAVLADFDILQPPHGANGAFLADTDFYQGVNAMRVLRRKSDGRLFGYKYWDTAGNDSWEPDNSGNGDDHPGTNLPEPDTNAPGFDWDRDWPPQTYVFLPVEPYTITGYRFPKDGDSSEY